MVSPTLAEGDHEFQIPERILQFRMIAGDHPERQGLIKWSRMHPSLATWENLDRLRLRFPHAPTWGQVVSQEEGNVSTSILPRTRRWAACLAAQGARAC
jgi:hypothetical protein